MPRISFTANLQRHVSSPPREVPAGTVREALEAVFAENPRLRSYLLDEHGRLRRHVSIYVNDRMIADRGGLADALAGEDEIFVFQALSGGR
ncbi:MAG: MoaD/ThiS family protein [Alphaproteobacteria bacterium]|nr:MoaD/ThiS family protein [Alphaproteobacteria bacterium]